MISVLQIIDTLEIGGAERLAVNYANELSQKGIKSHLCTTRAEGLLKNSIEKDVGYFFLKRKSTLDIKAVLRLRSYISKNNIDILHAHASSFFIASLVKLSFPKLKLIWHDHYGNSEFLNKRNTKVLRVCSLLFTQIFSVNQILEFWAKNKLWCKRVRYISNFPILKETHLNQTILKGENEKRIICLANLRAQKNHIRLLEAFKKVNETYPDWTLHCIGKDFEDSYSSLFFSKIEELKLNNHAFFYNSKSDVLNILQQSTIGVLVSKSEGLPLALLEYGIANLPVICTDVGDCGKLISDESYGILLENDKESEIANAIVNFIENKKYREASSKKYHNKIIDTYSSEVVINEVVTVYNTILN